MFGVVEGKVSLILFGNDKVLLLIGLIVFLEHPHLIEGLVPQAVLQLLAQVDVGDVVAHDEVIAHYHVLLRVLGAEDEVLALRVQRQGFRCHVLYFYPDVPVGEMAEIEYFPLIHSQLDLSVVLFNCQWLCG